MQKKEGEKEEKVGMCVLVSLCLHTKARGGHWMFSNIILHITFRDMFLKPQQTSGCHFD